MELIIDTSKNQRIVLELVFKKKSLIKKDFEASFTQAEKLLPEIDFLLKKIKKNIQDLDRIKIKETGGSFTALRIGIVTANALSYGLGIPVLDFENKNVKVGKLNLVLPKYSGEPNITIAKKKL